MTLGEWERCRLRGPTAVGPRTRSEDMYSVSNALNATIAITRVVASYSDVLHGLVLELT